MAVPAFRSSSNSGGIRVDVSNASYSLNTAGFMPSGIAADDILLLTVLGRNESAVDSSAGDGYPVINTPSGFTSITSLAETSSGARKNRFSAFWRRATGSDTTTISGENGGTTDFGVYWMMYAFSGCVTVGTPFEDVDGVAANGVNSLVGPDITTAGADRLGVYLVGRGANSAITQASGWTERAETGSTLGPDGRLGCHDIAIPTATTLSGGNVTFGGSNLSIIASLALIPPAGGGGASTRFRAFIAG